MIYLIVFNLSAIFYWLSNLFKRREIQYMFIFLSALTLILITGLRYYVGTDFRSYTYIFDAIDNLNFKDALLFSETEIGHNLLCKLIAVVGGDYRAMFFAYGFLNVFFLYKVLNKLKLNNYFFLLSYLFILFPFSFNTIRQGLVFIISLYSILCVFDNQKLKSILLLGLATLFHYSAVFMAPIVIAKIMIKQPKIRSLFILIFYVAIIILCLTGVLELIKIEGLTRYYQYSELASTINIFSYKASLLTLLSKLPILLLSLLYFKQLRAKNENFNLFFLVFIISILFPIFSSGNIILGRLKLYFTVFDLVLIAMITNTKHNIYLKILFYFYLIMYFIIIFYIYNYCEIFPYQTWL